MESTTDQYRPQEGISHDSTTTGTQPQFTNSFAPGQTESHLENPIGGTGTRERSSSKGEFSHTDEWDASKVPPSRFQQRKGSIYSTQGSRDGHVQKNKDRDTGFHETHTKLFGKAKEKVKEASEKVTGSHRRTSSSASKGSI
ncbi:hypothetical protein SCAR479_04714 [Seiridium cardinale]|uniref:Uncharacterized protein n=1 Tax=Seiridium cardinale TaxID=138064 RepID=A0ABR2XX56_9PEZI